MIGSRRFAVVVSGLPGSGKTTVAEGLAVELGLPWISKDTIKEVLADSLDLSADRSRDLGRAAVQVMLAVARHAPQVILESFFWPGLSEPELVGLRRPLIQVHCTCDPHLARARFESRVSLGERHHVHHALEDWDRFSQGSGLLALPGPLIEVDTSDTADTAVVARLLREALGPTTDPSSPPRGQPRRCPRHGRGRSGRGRSSRLSRRAG